MGKGFELENQIIDKFLKEVVAQNGGRMYLAEFCAENGYPIEKYMDIYNIMEYEKLVSDMGPTLVGPSAYGAIVVRNGGWLKELERRKVEAAEKERLERIDLENKIENTRFTKMQRKAFWPLFILSILGGIGGLVSLAIQLFGSK